MLHRLEFKVEFLNGKIIEDSHSFSEGLTSISGPNESGKTLRLELIRYALFGNRALRSTKEGYKTLNVSLEFSVKKDRYFVERKKSVCKLYKNNNLVCTGIKETDKEIHNIFGFGIEIFDLACSINQGEVEQLTKLSAQERKKLINKLIGFSLIEDFIDKINRKCSELKSVLKVYDTLTPPKDPPEPPDGYCSSDILLLEYQKALKLEQKLSLLEPLIKHPIQEPSDPLPGKDLSLLKKNLERDILETYLATLEDFPFSQLEVSQKLKIQNEWEKYSNYKLEDLNYILNYNKKLELQQEKDRLLSSGYNVCPSCHYKWPKKFEELKNIESQLMELDSFIDPPYHLSNLEVKELIKKISNLQKPEPPIFTPQDLEKAKKSEERKIVLQKLSNLPKEKISEEIFQLKSKYEADKKKYEEFIKYKKEYDDIKKDYVPSTPIMEKYRICSSYEQTKKIIEEEKKRYLKLLEDKNKLVSELQDYENCKKALLEFRTEIKNYIFPSLSKVSSEFLFIITGGAKTNLSIDDEMNISVDNYNVDTLSGSTKAAVNIALRLALGRILINKIFPVLLADEIDFSMDYYRTKNTFSLLKDLKKQFYQIICISHKKVDEADHNIGLVL